MNKNERKGITNDNDYNEFYSKNKHRGEDYIKPKRYEEWKNVCLALEKRGLKTPSYEEYYHMSKEKELIDHELKEQRKEIMRQKAIRDDFEKFQQEELGYFHFNVYENLLLLNLESQYLTRFIYLCCFLDFDDNKIKWGKINGGNAVVKDLEEIWRLKEEECRKTKNALIEKGLMTINEDKTIEINKEYAFKGKGKKDMKGSVKMFENGFKEIYENATPKEHKRLGMLIKLLPSVNYTHNVLCSNPSETDVTKIYPLSLKDICRIVGYAEKNSSRLKKELLNLTVNDELVVKITQTKYGVFIYINPRVYYKGHDIDDLKGTINEFRMGSNTSKK